MRYLKTKNQSKASNFMFDHNTLQAWSYDWWCFSAKYKNKLIFNNSYYSNTTNRHQSKAKGLLAFDIDIELRYTTCNLTSVESALNYEVVATKFQIKKLIRDIRKPRTHKAKNIERKLEIKKLIKHISEIRFLLNK